MTILKSANDFFLTHSKTIFYDNFKRHSEMTTLKLRNISQRDDTKKNLFDNVLNSSFADEFVIKSCEIRRVNNEKFKFNNCHHRSILLCKLLLFQQFHQQPLKLHLELVTTEPKRLHLFDHNSDYSVEQGFDRSLTGSVDRLLNK